MKTDHSHTTLNNWPFTYIIMKLTQLYINIQMTFSGRFEIPEHFTTCRKVIFISSTLYILSIGRRCQLQQPSIVVF